MPLTDWLSIFKKAAGIKPGNPKEVREHIARSIAARQRRSEPDENLGRQEEPEPEPPYSGPKQNIPWLYANSSNVHSFRWVGGRYPLQVRFRKELWWYGYDVSRETYIQLVNAPSKGRFIWYLRLGLKAPYLRYYPGSIPPRILYPWGAVGSPEVY
jgi:hypothetical protein